MAKKSTGKSSAGKAKKTTKKAAKKKTAKKPAASSAKKTTRKTANKTQKKVADKATARSSKKTSKKAKKSPAKSVKKAGRPASRKLDRFKSPLTKKQLAQFRQKLLEKRRDLLGDMTAIEHTALGNGRDGSGDLMPTHPADLGSDNYEQEFTLGLLESERTLLKEIHEALERIDDGTYGICVGTAKPIGLPRLNARPWAKHCIEYARMVEKGLVRPGETLFDDEEDGEEE